MKPSKNLAYGLYCCWGLEQENCKTDYTTIIRKKYFYINLLFQYTFYSVIIYLVKKKLTALSLKFYGIIIKNNPQQLTKNNHKVCIQRCKTKLHYNFGLQNFDISQCRKGGAQESTKIQFQDILCWSVFPKYVTKTCLGPIGRFTERRT